MRGKAFRVAAAMVIGAMVLGAPANAQPQSPAHGCTGLGGTVSADGICRVVSESETYAIDMSYPLGYPDQQTLTDFLRQHRDAFVDFVATIPHDRTYDYGVTSHTYTSGSPASGTASVVLELYGDTGAHPVTSFQAFNYDLAERAPIILATLFAPGADPAGLLDPIVQRELEKHWQGYLNPAPHNTLGAKVYENFALTDDAVIFYIGQGMWLPEVAGPQRVSVPRDELQSIVAWT
jgi:hypothetical protein